MFNEKFPQPPWVTRLDESADCEAIVYNRYSLRKANSLNPEVRRAHAARVTCKNPARWHHKAMEVDASDPYAYAGQTGVFCWSHLVHQAMGSMEDHARYEAWLAER